MKKKLFSIVLIAMLFLLAISTVALADDKNYTTSLSRDLPKCIKAGDEIASDVKLFVEFADGYNPKPEGYDCASGSIVTVDTNYDPSNSKEGEYYISLSVDCGERGTVTHTVTFMVISGDLYVNGADIITAENNTVQCGEGTAVYDAATNTLTLDNVNTVSVEKFINAQNMGELTIKVVGNNTLDTKKTQSTGTRPIERHIYAENTNIKIIGDSAGSSKLTLKNICNNGIYVKDGVLTIEKVTLDISGIRNHAIQSGELNIKDSKVTVTTVATTEANGNCIYMIDDTAAKNQDIIIDNSTLDLTSANGAAINFKGNIGEIIIATGNALAKAEGDSTDLLDGKTAAQVLNDVKTQKYKKILLQVTDKQLYVNGEDIITAPDNTVACGEGTAKYDIDSNTLTLTNAEIENEYGIYIDHKSGTELTTKLVLVGENKIEAERSGIWSEKGDLEISGTGSLTIKNYQTSGINMCRTGNIDILGDSADEMLKIEINSGSEGICGGELTIKNAEVNITRAAGSGMRINKLTIKNALLDSSTSYNAIGFNDFKHEVEISDTLVKVENDGEDWLAGKTKAEIVEMIAQEKVGKRFILRTVDRVYTVGYEPGAYGIGDSESALKIHGDDLELADELFTRSGYKQVGWATSDGGEKVYDLAGTYTANEAVTLYPAWQKKSSSYVAQVPSYTLSFVTNGGSGIGAINQSSDVTIDLSEYKTTRDGYTFMGWYSDKALKNKISSIKLDSDTTIYAAWQEIAKEEEKTPSVVEKPFDFVDVHSNDWFYDDVKWAFEQGLMMGTTADNFSPNTFTTRGMIVTILWRMEGSPVVNYALPFSDVADGMWYSEAVRWAVSEHIVSGYSATRFAPEDNITREQLAAMLYNYAKYKGIDVSVGEDTNILSYDDAFDISEYAYEALQWAVGEGVIGGMTDSTIAPQNLATRAQVAAMLHRFVGIV